MSAARPSRYELDRRRLLQCAPLGVAALARALADRGVAIAAGSNVVGSVPGSPLAFEIGAFKCRVYADGALSAPASFLFSNADPGELAALLSAHDLDPEAIDAGLNCLLIDLDGQRILWDTGTGGRWHDGLGQLARALEADGVAPDSIDRVVISHGHPDHIGGLLDAAGRPSFPRARFPMTEAEWRHWTDEAWLAGVAPPWAAVAREVLPQIADRLETVSGETELLPGVRLLPSPGHTPGHLALELESRGERLLCVGDAVGHPLSVQRPDWLTGSDGDPVRAPTSRRQLVERAAESGSLVFANHFLFPGLGRIDGEAGRRVWRAWVR